MTDNLSTYQKLQNQLSELIEKSPKGTKLLSEPELAQEFGVSRATLREVMRTFESQGLLRRRQGLGTFVVKPTRVIESGLEVLESIETQAKKIGLEVSMGEMEMSYIRADEEQVEKLGCKKGEMLIRVQRVILSEGAPAAFLVDILPRGIISHDILSNQFTGSVLDLLINIGKPSLSISRTEISAINAPEDVAKALDIQRGDTLLLLKGVLFNTTGEPVDLSYSYFLPGHFRLQIIRKIGGVTS